MGSCLNRFAIFGHRKWRLPKIGRFLCVSFMIIRCSVFLFTILNYIREFYIEEAKMPALGWKSNTGWLLFSGTRDFKIRPHLSRFKLSIELCGVVNKRPMRPGVGRMMGLAIILVEPSSAGSWSTWLETHPREYIKVGRSARRLARPRGRRCWRSADRDAAALEKSKRSRDGHNSPRRRRDSATCRTGWLWLTYDIAIDPRPYSLTAQSANDFNDNLILERNTFQVALAQRLRGRRGFFSLFSNEPSQKSIGFLRTCYYPGHGTEICMQLGATLGVQCCYPWTTV